MKIYNIYENINFDKDKEIEELIFENNQVKILRTTSLTQVTDYYDQEELEIVKIVEGFAILEIEGKEIKLKKGDILPISPHQVHRVIYQDHVVWLCIFVKK